MERTINSITCFSTENFMHHNKIPDTIAARIAIKSWAINKLQKYSSIVGQKKKEYLLKNSSLDPTDSNAIEKNINDGKENKHFIYSTNFMKPYSMRVSQ